MNDESTASLYIHIPFCVKKCAYCAFYSLPRSVCGDSVFDDYTDALIRRIRSMPRLNVPTVYFGGGTPTVLSAASLCRVLDEIAKRHNLSDDAEITLEANPGTLDGKDMSILHDSGFNRLSLGLQSADDKTLAALGRIHNLDCFLGCYSDATRYFSNISLDMIFALPFGGIEKTISLIQSLSPAHISAYSLTLEENTPLFGCRDTLCFPSEDEEEKQYHAVCEAFSDYRHYEVSSFARKGFESHHNLNYWKRGQYIGIGAAAHSFYRGRRFSVPADVNAFISHADSSFLSDTDFDSVLPVTPEEAAEERIMLGLRTSDGVALDGERLEKARNISALGYGTVTGNVFALNDRGFRVSNTIIADLI